MDRVMALGRRRPDTRAESIPALSSLRNMLTVGTAGNESAAVQQKPLFVKSSLPVAPPLWPPWAC